MRDKMKIAGLLFFVTTFTLISQTNNHSLSKLKKIYTTAVKNYVDTVDSDDLEEAAIKGMLKELDPHSKYFPPKRMKDISDNLRGNFEGIGIESSMIDDTVTIIKTNLGGPSEAVGVLSGDKIITIDGENVVAVPRKDLSTKLRGPKGSKVTIQIKRANIKDLITIEITRAKIPINSVDAAFIIDGTDIGYVSIKSFSATTYSDFVDSLVALRKKGMKKLILDLHGNPGGYLSQAYEIADELIVGEQKIVYTLGRNTRFNKDYVSTYGGEFEDLPIICISDRNAASASEILMGAIQDLDRGLIVGETSYGKGLVQRQYKNSDGSGFRITTSRYYTPSGRCIQRPFDDKEKYSDFEGRIELDDGTVLQNWLKEKQETMPKDSILIYKTKSGRLVPGGGGIAPDYIVKYDTLTELTKELRNNRLFFIFANYYIDNKANRFQEKYKNDFLKFSREFKISQQIIKNFKKIAEEKYIEWNDDDYKVDKDKIDILIKSELTRRYWKTNELKETLLPYYRQISKAIELFPEAEKLAEIE